MWVTPMNGVGDLRDLVALSVCQKQLRIVGGGSDDCCQLVHRQHGVGEHLAANAHGLAWQLQLKLMAYEAAG